eukprot:COSAG02_NODE_60263_length_272_cov_0.254335_1_plen_60_part_01
MRLWLGFVVRRGGVGEGALGWAVGWGVGVGIFFNDRPCIHIYTLYNDTATTEIYTLSYTL